MPASGATLSARMNEYPTRQIRAEFDDESITVYQAYSPQIAEPAVARGRFVSPFKIDRMTWIKPSFLWMMYRSGWATKPGQERVLAIRLTRTGFEKALSRSSLSHFDGEVYSSHDEWLRIKAESPVRIQWDPERNAALEPLPWRAIQIGLGGTIVDDYVNRWTLGIDDITDRVHHLRSQPFVASEQLPVERPYPLPPDIAQRIGASR